jgi:ACS family glucarate transporter-like MFS transporter
VLTRIVLWWSAFTSITGLVSNYYLLVVARFCFGMGEAGAYPNAGVVISRWFPAAKRTSAWGVAMMASQIGGALAPLLVVPIQMRYGWRASFYLFGGLGVMWAIAWSGGSAIRRRKCPVSVERRRPRATATMRLSFR